MGSISLMKYKISFMLNCNLKLMASGELQLCCAQASSQLQFDKEFPVSISKSFSPSALHTELWNWVGFGSGITVLDCIPIYSIVTGPVHKTLPTDLTTFPFATLTHCEKKVISNLFFFSSLFFYPSLKLGRNDSVHSYREPRWKVDAAAI